MIKKLSLVVLIFCISALQSSALNVIQENATLRKQLNSLSSTQQKENRKNILYYKGRSSYIGIDKSSYSSSFSYQDVEQKNIYEKKGVKFKVNSQKQEEKLKEIQEQEKTNVQVDVSGAEHSVEKSKVEMNFKTELQKNNASHNSDAE